MITCGFLKYITGDQNEASVRSASNGLLLLIKVLICNRQVCLNVCFNHRETKVASTDKSLYRKIKQDTILLLSISYFYALIQSSF